MEYTEALWREIKIAARSWAASAKPLPQEAEAQTAVRLLGQRQGMTLSSEAVAFYAAELTSMIALIRSEPAPA